MKFIFLFLINFVCCASLGQGASLLSLNKNEFPLWWDKVEVQELSIHSHSDLIQYKKSLKKCCNQEVIALSNRTFIKSLWENKESINDLDQLAYFVVSLNLKYTESEAFYNIQSKFLEQYLDYKMPIDNCKNCDTGDLNAKLYISIISGKEFKSEDAFRTLVKNTISFLDKRNDIFSYYQVSLIYSMVDNALKLNFLSTFNRILDDKIIQKKIDDFRSKKYSKNVLIRQTLKKLNKRIEDYNSQINHSRSYLGIGIGVLFFLIGVFWYFTKKKN